MVRVAAEAGFRVQAMFRDGAVLAVEARPRETHPQAPELPCARLERRETAVHRLDALRLERRCTFQTANALDLLLPRHDCRVRQDRVDGCFLRIERGLVPDIRLGEVFQPFL